MQIIEQLVIGKRSQQDCEDGIVANENFVAVIDGSTSKTLHRYHPDKSNGQYAMQLIAEFIGNMPSDITLNDFCNSITSRLNRIYSTESTLLSDNGDTTLHKPAPENRLCASAIIFSRLHREIWMIGDCQCMVDGTIHQNPKPYEDPIAARRAAWFEQCVRENADMIEGKTILRDYAREKIIPLLIDAMQQQNISYAVIDGTPIYNKGVKVVRVEGQPAEIVLASDGYPFLHSTLAESEKALQAQLAADPFNISSFIATKGLMKGNSSFDDRSYIRFKA